MKLNSSTYYVIQFFGANNNWNDIAGERSKYFFTVEEARVALDIHKKGNRFTPLRIVKRSTVEEVVV